MNDQEPKSRVKRYDFNQGNTRQPPKRRRPIWPWILTLVTLFVAVGIVLAINATPANHPSSSNEATSSQDHQAADASSASETTRVYDHFKRNLDQRQQDGLTSADEQSLESEINQMSDSTVQQRAKELLNKAKASQQTSQTQASQSSSSSKGATSGSHTRFSTIHTFSSVADAQSWAQATKSQWLAQGYTTYTVTSDGQGNYNLQFVK